ncbi:GDSL esterase/lipase 1-like [Quercus lobata]|uniref:GDSL esterase/lipase 1-like n=1 Tax=Quercus lobata TaxID=97700 RepID=A0A7N2LJJ9_QUELO|nr:GDSL esterase/lipase 1-like [Quercus lobata]
MMDSRVYFSLLVLFTAFFIATHCLPQPEEHAALFIFGDSTYDAGNNNYIKTTDYYRSNYVPYGETFFKRSTGRFSDGRLASDFIAEFAKLPYITPYLQPGYNQFTDGANFASAGAGALAETYKSGNLIDLKSQLSYFTNFERQLIQKLGDAKAKALLSRAVYLIAIGSNDYAAAVSANSSASPEEYVNMVNGNLTSVIREIYNKGGRKFGIPNLEPMGCLPSAKAVNPSNTSACFQALNDLTQLHNKALSEALQKLANELDGFKYSLADAYTALSDKINNPSKYGFKEANIACCGSGPFRGTNSCGGKRLSNKYELCENVSEYVFFDGGHTTEKANEHLANLMWSGTPNIAGPYNLKALFEL